MQPQSASLIAQAIACLKKASRIEGSNNVGEDLDEIIEDLDDLTDEHSESFKDED